MAEPLSQPTDIPADAHTPGTYGSFAPTSPLASRSIARDLELQRENGHDDEEDPRYARRPSGLAKVKSNQASQGYAAGGSYRRPSFVAAVSGTRSTTLPALQKPGVQYLTEEEQEAVIDEERSLLRDNDVIPPKHPRKSSEPALSPQKTKHSNIITKQRQPQNTDDDPSKADNGNAESSPLLPKKNDPKKNDPTKPYGGNTREDIEHQWEAAVKEGKIQTTWQREAKVISRYSRSLILTFLLQYSLPLASIFAVSRIGTMELGAISLATMTANITGYAIFQGLATSLDTLCAQAYGSGNKKLVGLQLQRMVLFLWVCCIPIGAIWLNGTRILEAIVPEKETAALAGMAIDRYCYK